MILAQEWWASTAPRIIIHYPSASGLGGFASQSHDINDPSQLLMGLTTLLNLNGGI